MSVLIARKIIEDWLIKRGCKVEEELSDKEVVFIEGNNRIYVRIAHEEFPSESFIIDELNIVMKNRLKYNKAYLAFPINARGFINGKLFRSQWVGVYLYNLDSTDPDKSVEELIPSIPLQTQSGDVSELVSRINQLETSIKTIQESLSQISNEDVRNELNELRDKINRIEGELNNLINRVTSLERDVQAIRQSGSRIIVNEGPVSNVQGELPDYLSNNPWVEVLRRKGGSGG